MSELRDLATRLTESLELSQPPIAVALRDELPPEVEAFSGQVPAGCRFWQEATQRTFATSTADHELCAIGVHTHSLAEPSPRAQGELGEVLKVMADLDYVREDEVAGIPTVARSSRHVVYGPLAEAPLPPDVVLVFADSAQGLVISEATQRVDGALAPALGRPACAVVPQALNSGRAALSLGCCGARAYLDALSDAVALWALPGVRLAEYVEVIAAMGQANTTLAAFHARRRADVEAGQRPTLEESLQRM